MGILDLFDPEKAEAAPAVKGFAKKYDKAVREGDKRMMYAGSLDDDVYKSATKKDPSVKQNKVYVGPHGGQARSATEEMTPFEVGRHIENLLNSGETRVLPNFPSANFRDQAKGMLYLNDGKNVVSPFMAGRQGDIVLKTLFQPDFEKRKFIEGYLGRPLSPISGLRDNPASAQPPGLSAVRQPSTEENISDLEGPYKKNLPALAGTLTGLSVEPGLESPLIDPVDLLLAPFGVTGVGPKTAAVVSEPFVSYGMDKLIGGILSLFDEEE